MEQKKFENFDAHPCANLVHFTTKIWFPALGLNFNLNVVGLRDCFVYNKSFLILKVYQLNHKIQTNLKIQ